MTNYSNRSRLHCVESLRNEKGEMANQGISHWSDECLVSIQARDAGVKNLGQGGTRAEAVIEERKVRLLSIGSYYLKLGKMRKELALHCTYALVYYLNKD